MEGESKRALKCLTNQPASVHNYGKLSKSESPRNHSSPTSILRKFPHSLRHDQKHRTKLKREISPIDLIVSGASAVDRGEGEANRFVVSRCARGEGSDDPGHGTSSEDAERRREDDEDGHDRTWKKRKFGATSSDCSRDGDVWKLRPGAARADETSVGEFVTGFPRDDSTDRSDEKTVGSAFKLSVINNPCLNGSSVNRASRPKRRSEFPVHKSTPNLLRSETFNVSTFASRPEYAADRSSGGKPPSRRELARNGRHVPLKTSDSLPQLDQTYRIIHSILPKINRTISESHESLSGLKIGTPHVKSEPHIESFPDDDDDDDRTEASRSRTFEFGKSDSSQSEDESDGLGLIEGRRSAVVQSAKDRKKRWTYKKTVDLVPGLKNFMNRRSRNGGDAEEAAPPGAAAPLMRDGSPRAESCSSLVIPQIRCFDEEDEDVSAKKREAVEALTNLIRADSHLQVEPIRPVNRLRVPPNGFYGSTSRMCSRCSSLLSMASSSRYSINTTGSGFVSCSPSLEKPSEPSLLCKLCLMEVPVSQSMEIGHCGCIFCKDCMRLYVEFEIQEGAYDISCPDAQCAKQGVVTLGEVEALVTPQMMERYLRFRLNHEVDMDWNRTWCPRAGCETVCDICPREKCSPTSVHCPTCDSDFCSNCKNAWHEGLTCEGNSRKLAKEGRSDFMEPGIPFDSDSIKCCPMCNVPIEKDEGCAQMMCKRCKHVFCWYCLASLDDDFLLRHYDKGPCKNKLGHSRASVIWHRTQVIGIFAGLGLLLLVASPLLLLAAPCIVCCKCRVCSGTKLDADDDLPEESGT